jgi:hypothetical protein
MDRDHHFSRVGALFAFLASVVGGSATSCGSTETSCADGIGCVAQAGTAGANGGSAGHSGAAETGGSSASRAGGGSGGSGGSGGMSGRAGRGGDASGGTAGDAGSAGSSGEGGAPPCNAACAGAKPVCNAATNTCVACLAHTDCGLALPACDLTAHVCVQCAAKADCTESAKPACDLTAHACVQCAAKADCTDPAKPLCDTTLKQCVTCLAQSDCLNPAASACNAGQCQPCSKDAECSNIAGKGVCSAGNCVRCTGTNFSACGQDAGTAFVCDSLKHTCSTSKQHSSGLCQACLADAQCNAGEICVLDRFGSPPKDVGYFCHWKQGDTANGAPADCFTGGQPYVGVQKNAVSVDGITSDICGLAVSTCVARNQFRAKDCLIASAPSDAACGVSPAKDSKCLQVGTSGNYRCTMTCGSDVDCPSPFTCNTGVSPAVCNLN